MPKKSSKTPSNVVRTVDRYNAFTLGELFKGDGRTNSYSATKQEFYLAIDTLFSSRNSPATEYTFTAYAGSYGKNTFRATKDTNGLLIGCMHFSQNATRKIARWAGFSSKFVRQYIG